MNPSLSDTGKIIDKVENFGERFGFPAIITIMVVGSLIFALYAIINYEILDSKVKINAMSTSIDTMVGQHKSILETTSKSLIIQCATCWNTANDQAEIKRCSCSLSQ